MEPLRLNKNRTNKTTSRQYRIKSKIKIEMRINQRWSLVAYLHYTNVQNAAKALGELAHGIAPNAFNSDWLTKKTAWLKNASTITSASGAGKLLGQLGGFLKPGALKSGFDLSKWIGTANTLKSFSGVGSSIKSLLGGMNTASLTSDLLKNKDSYMSVFDTRK